MVAMVVDSSGVRQTANAADIREQTRAAKFFWLDIFGGNDVTRTELLGGLGLDSSDINWAVRFGQAGRLYIGRDKLRAVTWMADHAGNLCEIHVLSSPQCILTIWQGDAAALDEIRQQFGEQADGFEKSHFAAAGLIHFKSRSREKPPLAAAQGIEEWMARQSLKENIEPEFEAMAAALPPERAKQATA